MMCSNFRLMSFSSEELIFSSFLTFLLDCLNREAADKVAKSFSFSHGFRMKSAAPLFMAFTASSTFP
ncbi:hypothetical protein D3C86_1890070 [compost metagenome]